MLPLDPLVWKMTPFFGDPSKPTIFYMWHSRPCPLVRKNNTTQTKCYNQSVRFFSLSCSFSCHAPCTPTWATRRNSLVLVRGLPLENVFGDTNQLGTMPGSASNLMLNDATVQPSWKEPLNTCCRSQAVTFNIMVKLNPGGKGGLPPNSQAIHGVEDSLTPAT